MKFICLGNKLPEELNEYLRTLKCSALGSNLLQSQGKARVLYLGIGGLELRSSSATNSVVILTNALYLLKTRSCPSEMANDAFLPPRTGVRRLT